MEDKAKIEKKNSEQINVNNNTSYELNVQGKGILSILNVNEILK